MQASGRPQFRARTAATYRPMRYSEDKGLPRLSFQTKSAIAPGEIACLVRITWKKLPLLWKPARITRYPRRLQFLHLGTGPGRPKRPTARHLAVDPDLTLQFDSRCKSGLALFREEMVEAPCWSQCYDLESLRGRAAYTSILAVASRPRL